MMELTIVGLEFFVIRVKKKRDEMDKIKLLLPTNLKYGYHPGLSITSILAAIEIVSEKGEGTRITMIKNLAISYEI